MTQQLNNPLRQYFRRPAIYLRLPSKGKYANPNVVRIPESGELPVYPMTAIDDITAKTPDALFNGTAIVEVIKSCIPDILDPWEINNIDLDAALIAIRTASEGNAIEINSSCPNCSEVSTYEVNLVGYLGQLSADHYDEELTLGDLTIKFRSLPFKIINSFNLKQFEIQQAFNEVDKIKNADEKSVKTAAILSSITEMTIDALSNTIEYIKTPTVSVTEVEYILDFLKNCDKNIYESIKDKNIELKKKSDMDPLHVQCSHCKHEYDQPISLNFTDFFG